MIVVPVYNEMPTLEIIVEQLKDACDRVIVVDDGSSDGTSGKLARMADSDGKIDAVFIKDNAGKSDALKKGFDRVLDPSIQPVLADSDLVITTDGDGQLPADVIAPACEYFIDNRLDLLIGDRDFSMYPFIKRLGNIFLSFIASALTGFHFNDTQCGFRIFTIAALKQILPYYKARRYACEQETSIIGALLGLKIDNSFSLAPAYYRSNSTYLDAAYITLDSFFTFFRVILKKKDEPGIKRPAGCDLGHGMEGGLS